MTRAGLLLLSAGTDLGVEVASRDSLLDYFTVAPIWHMELGGEYRAGTAAVGGGVAFEDGPYLVDRRDKMFSDGMDRRAVTMFGQLTFGERGAVAVTARAGAEVARYDRFGLTTPPISPRTAAYGELRVTRGMVYFATRWTADRGTAPVETLVDDDYVVELEAPAAAPRVALGISRQIGDR